jgi:hypothetical protein
MRCQHKKAITTAMHTGGCRGNLIVRLKVKGHPKLQRIGSTISSCINIPWAYLPAREGIICCHCCTFVCCVLSSILTYSSLAKIGLGLLWLPAACPESACWCNAHHAVQAHTACIEATTKLPCSDGTCSRSCNKDLCDEETQPTYQQKSKPGCVW